MTKTAREVARAIAVGAYIYDRVNVSALMCDCINALAEYDAAGAPGNAPSHDADWRELIEALEEYTDYDHEGRDAEERTQALSERLALELVKLRK